MKLRQRGLVASILMATLVVSPLVEAKRAGGGHSQGMTRSVAPSQSYQQQRAPSYAQPAPAPVQQQRQGSGVGKMVAAGVAGAAVGAIAANAMADNHNNNAAAPTQATATAASQPAQQPQQQAQQEEKKSGIPGWLWLVILGGIGFFVFRKMNAKKKPVNNSPFTGNPPPSGGNTNVFGQSTAGGTAYTNNGNQLPDGTEPAAFLRIARQRFNHIQAMNTASNIEEIRRYLTPDLYNSMYQDIMANRDQDVAEFENLNAMIADSATENGQYVVSVRFTGTVTEDLNSAPKPFSEVWHFVKPLSNQQDWLVAGIQVES